MKSKKRWRFTSRRKREVLILRIHELLRDEVMYERRDILSKACVMLNEWGLAKAIREG